MTGNYYCPGDGRGHRGVLRGLVDAQAAEHNNNNDGDGDDGATVAAAKKLR